MKGISLNTILLIGVAVLLTLQLNSCFSKVHKPEQMIRNEERLKYLEKERLADSIALVERRVQYDSVTALLMKKDTVIVTKLIANDKKQQNIITVVRDASKDELRRFVTEY